MSDEELKNLWRQPLTPPSSGTATDVVAGMRKRMRKFDKTIFWRDVRELAACVFVFIFFAVYYFRVATALSRAGCVVIVLSAVFIAGKILAAHRMKRRNLVSASVRDFLLGEVEKVSRQIRLLETVVWWYLLPLFIGVELFSWGGAAPVQDKVVNLVVTLFVYAVLYWANRYAARKSLRPLKEQLEQTLHELPEFFDKGESFKP
jgi:hypothetical protein